MPQVPARLVVAAACAVVWFASAAPLARSQQLSGAARVGELWASGQNVRAGCSGSAGCIGGQLGVGDLVNRAEFEPVREASPTPAPVLDRVGQVSAGHRHTLVLRADGTVLATGDNRFGQLGLGHTTGQTTPLPISSLGRAVSLVEAGWGFSLMLVGSRGSLEGAQLWACGQNRDGQLGMGDTTQRHAPARVTVSGQSLGWASVAAGESHVLAVTVAGELWAWGTSVHGSLGLGRAHTRTLLPMQVGQSTPSAHAWPGPVRSAAAYREHSVLVHESGVTSASGNNAYGQLGFNSPAGTDLWNFYFAQTDPMPPVAKIALGLDHTVFLMQDGTLRACGRNDQGQLGFESNGAVSTPQAVPVLQQVVQLDAGDDFTVAMRADGSLWVMGNNEHGQLGLLRSRTSHEQSSPTRVHSLGSAVSDVVAGFQFVMVIKGACNADGLWPPSHVLDCTCSPCPRGKYSGAIGEHCRAGSVADLHECLLCPVGQYSDVDGAAASSDCIECSAGTYGPVEGLPTCIQCERGRYIEATRTIDGCEACYLGKFTRSTGSATPDECEYCEVGSIASTEHADDWQNFCEPCPTGSYGMPVDVISVDLQCGQLVFAGECVDSTTWTSGDGRNCDAMRAFQSACASTSGSLGDIACMQSGCQSRFANEACPAACGRCVNTPYRLATGQDGLQCDTFRLDFHEPKSFCGDAQWMCFANRCTCNSPALSQIELKVRAFTGDVVLRVDMVDHHSHQTSFTPLTISIPGNQDWVTHVLEFTAFKTSAGVVVDAQNIAGLILYVLDGNRYAPFSGEFSIASIRHLSDGTMLHEGSTGDWIGLSAVEQETGCVPCSVGRSNSNRGVVSEHGDGDAVCSLCASGLVAPSGSDICRQCPAGKWTNIGPDVPGRAECVACPFGQFSAVEGAMGPVSEACEPCPVGRFASVQGSSACTGCGVGRYSDVTGATSDVCIDCAAGRFRNSTEGRGDVASCDVCPSGRVSMPGARLCELCPVGKGLADESESGPMTDACEWCGVGTFSRRDVKRFPRRYNTITEQLEQPDDIEYQACESCPPGRWQSETGSVHCNACDSGRANPADGSSDISACLQCSPGTRSSAGDEACTGCEHGTTWVAIDEDCAGCPAGTDSGFESSCTTCRREEICLGNGTCAVGYKGRWCSNCASGYFEYHRHCFECPPNSFLSFFFALSLFLLFALVMLRLGKVSSNQAMGGVVAPAALGFARLQVSLKVFEINFELPDFVLDALKWLSDLITLDFVGFATPDCLIPQPDPEVQYLFRIVESSAVLPALCLMILVLSLIWVTAVTVDRDRPNPINSMVTAFSLMYVALFSAGLRTLNCEKISGEWRLEDKLDVRCVGWWVEPAADLRREQTYAEVGEGFCLATDVVQEFAGHSGNNIDANNNRDITVYMEVNARVRDGLLSQGACEESCSQHQTCIGYAFTGLIAPPTVREAAGRCFLYGPGMDVDLPAWNPQSDSAEWSAYSHGQSGMTVSISTSTVEACLDVIQTGCCMVSDTMQASPSCQPNCCDRGAVGAQGETSGWLFLTKKAGGPTSDDRFCMDGGTTRGLAHDVTEDDCRAPSTVCMRKQTHPSYYYMIAITGISILVIFGIVTPVVLFRKLSSNDRMRPLVTKRYGWMYHRFEARAWYFEFVVMGQKAIIVSIATLLGRPNRAWSAWVCMMISILLMLILQLRVKPWVEREDDPRIRLCCGRCCPIHLTLNRLEEAGLFCQLLTVIPCSYFIVYDDTTSKLAVGLGISILGTQGMFIMAVLLVQYYKVRQADNLLNKYVKRAIDRIDGNTPNPEEVEDTHIVTGNPVAGINRDDPFGLSDVDDIHTQPLHDFGMQPAYKARSELVRNVQSRLATAPQSWAGWDEKTTTLYQNLQAVIESKAYEIDQATVDGRDASDLEDELARALVLFEQLASGSLRRVERTDDAVDDDPDDHRRGSSDETADRHAGADAPIAQNSLAAIMLEDDPEESGGSGDDTAGGNHHRHDVERDVHSSSSSSSNVRPVTVRSVEPVQLASSESSEDWIGDEDLQLSDDSGSDSDSDDDGYDERARVRRQQRRGYPSPDGEYTGTLRVGPSSSDEEQGHVSESTDEDADEDAIRTAFQIRQVEHDDEDQHQEMTDDVTMLRKDQLQETTDVTMPHSDDEWLDSDEDAV